MRHFPNINYPSDYLKNCVRAFREEESQSFGQSFGHRVRGLSFNVHKFIQLSHVLD